MYISVIINFILTHITIAMKKILVVLVITSIFACNNEEKYEQIAGEWECESWTVTGSDTDKCNGNVYFKFNADKTYESKIGAAKDTGTYKITNTILYTHAAGKEEIAVEILKLNDKTLKLLMNQGGQEEILTLGKK